MCEIGKADRSFGESKVPRYFHSASCDTVEGGASGAPVVAEKNRISSELSHLKNRERFSPSALPVSGVFAEAPVISRGCASGWNSSRRAGKCAVRQYRGDGYSRLYRVSVRSGLSQFPFCATELRYRCSPPVVRQLVDFMEFLPSFRTGVSYRAIT